MGEEGNKKGFSGLDSLVSDVSRSAGGKDKTIGEIGRTSKPPSEQKTATAGTRPERTRGNTGYPGTGPLPAQQESSSQKKKSTGSRGWAVFLGMIGVIGILYWASESSRTRVDDYRSLIKAPNYQSSGYSAGKAVDSGEPASDVVKTLTALPGRDDPLDKQGICELQELLGELGHYNSTVDGISGPGTRRAIAALVSDHPEIDNFEPTTRVLNYARSKITRDITGMPTSAKMTLPRSGQVMSRRSQGEAPFKISTPPGENYYVKLVDVPGESTIMTFFVRGGQTEELNVPYGNYSLRYAAGRTWYGPTCLFGRNTSYFETDRTLRFYRDGAQIVGHRVELIRQLHGNMDANTISAGRF